MAKVNDELVKAITEGDLLQVLLSELSGECNMNSLYVFKDKKGYDWKATPLIAAAALGHTELVQGFIDRADIDVDGVDENENSAFIVAAERGQVAVVRQLLASNKVDINFRGEYKETALYKAAEKGQVAVVRQLLEHPDINVNLPNDSNVTPLVAAAESGHVVTTKLFLERIEVDDAIRHPALLAACVAGKDKVVAMLLARTDMDVNVMDKYGDTPLMAAAEDGSVANVTLLLANPATLVNAQGSRNQTALGKAAQYGNIGVIQLLLDHGADPSILDKDGDTCLELALKEDQYEAAVVLLASGMPVHHIHFKDKLVLEWVAPYLTHDVAIRLLQLDFPVERTANGNIAARDSHSFSWSTFLDSHVPVDTSVRVAVVATLLGTEKDGDDWVRELATAKDQHGREALHTTDAATRDLLNGLRFFCGRYELFDGPPIHVSATAVVVNAYDHGVFRQVFEQFANDCGELDKKGFQACGRLLGQQPTDVKKKVDAAVEFDLWDKDKSGYLSASEYIRYCDQTYGGKLKVAMKFMRNADEHAREVDTRADLDIHFVLGLLPTLPQATFHANVASLTLHGRGVAMANYPHVLVMPAADRSLEDVFLKERPNDNQIRSMLHQVAEALAHLHDHGVVHGDLKKLNVLRVNHRMRLIDMDAATPFGAPVGAKFSSGSLPPEMFYKLQNDDEFAAIAIHWQRTTTPHTLDDVWAKVQPRDQFCIKTFHESASTLPFQPVVASPALDVWAFGVLMYQMYSGVELVPTDINQDVDDSGIARAATWTDTDLSKRLQNKVSNALARDLMAKLLVVDPSDRISVHAMLSHPYFEVKYDDATGGQRLLVERLDALAVQVTTGFHVMASRLDEVVDLTKETLNAVGAAKQDLMRGIFEATEVAFPTSFVILPFDLTLPQCNDDDNDPEDMLRDVTSFIQKGIDMGHNFMAAVHQNKAISRALRLVGPGEPLFLYLIDEVHGLPVVPTSPGSHYPIRIETKSDEYTQFMSAAMPYIQTGFRLLKGASTIASLVSCLGVLPSLDPNVLDEMGEHIENAQKTSSVFDFDVLQTAVEDQGGVPVQHIRGAALRELERFFKKNDRDKDYAGLCRTYASNGQALWTTKATVASMELARPTSTASLKSAQANQTRKAGGGKTAQQVYMDLLALHDLAQEDAVVERMVPPMLLPQGKMRSNGDRPPNCCGMM